MGVLEISKEQANEIKRKEVLYLAEHSGLPKAQWKTTGLIPEKVDESAFNELQYIRKRIVDFVNKGDNLYICSNNVGNGKTTWSIKMLIDYFRDDRVWAGNGFIVRGLFVHVPTLLYKLKDFNNPYSDEYMNDLLNCDIVIFDDIACQEKLSAYDENQLLIIIQHRLFNKKSCIFTSNVTNLRDLASALGSRLASRVYECSKVIEIKGKGRRRF